MPLLCICPGVCQKPGEACEWNLPSSTCPDLLGATCRRPRVTLLFQVKCAESLTCLGAYRRVVNQADPLVRHCHSFQHQGQPMPELPQWCTQVARHALKRFHLRQEVVDGAEPIMDRYCKLTNGLKELKNPVFLLRVSLYRLRSHLDYGPDATVDFVESLHEVVAEGHDIVARG